MTSKKEMTIANLDFYTVEKSARKHHFLLATVAGDNVTVTRLGDVVESNRRKRLSRDDCFKVVHIISSSLKDLVSM